MRQKCVRLLAQHLHLVRLIDLASVKMKSVLFRKKSIRRFRNSAEKLLQG